MMGKNVFWGSVFSLVAALLQSTIISRLAMFQAKPDFVLMIIVFVAYLNGTMTGQLTGFFSGLLLDFISAAPYRLQRLYPHRDRRFSGPYEGHLFLRAAYPAYVSVRRGDPL
ncbi:hypothetical protein FACS1894200_12640 [Spirochaetia bacterium]|nr:hypothetical protein FACS1894200_12640 [Spirochaetia bacterium]